ncbi:MAG: hypothetical protein LDL41_12485 [Coleofasciculus sp. S288]|nr:hypothetical protein [Coleofasciculus sp. S288]
MVEPLVEKEVLECPKCHKKGLVRCMHTSDDVFQCVYCDYRHALTQSSQSSSFKGSGTLFVAFVTFLVLILAFLGV